MLPVPHLGNCLQHLWYWSGPILVEHLPNLAAHLLYLGFDHRVSRGHTSATGKYSLNVKKLTQEIYSKHYNYQITIISIVLLPK